MAASTRERELQELRPGGAAARFARLRGDLAERDEAINGPDAPPRIPGPPRER